MAGATNMEHVGHFTGVSYMKTALHCQFCYKDCPSNTIRERQEKQNQGANQ